MPEERLCPNCNEAVETGAVFCGNCGYKLISDPQPQPTVSQVYSNGPATDPKTTYPNTLAYPNMPAYAVPLNHHKQHWGAMALALGILGIGSGMLIPILGIGLGISGIVLVTMSYHLTHRRLVVASIIVSVLAILVGIGFWVNVVVHDPRLNPNANLPAATTGGTAKLNVQTPCYSLSFNTVLNVNNSKGSCTLNAYNGNDLVNSSNIYKVIASATALTSSSFTSYSKQAIEADFTKNLPSFTITKQASTTFAGSQAYYIQANKAADNTAVIEETILLTNNVPSNGDNFFDIIHAVNGNSANLSSIESGWQWND
jgi:hypothetical protein